MSATVYVAADGNWGSAEPGELIVLHGISAAGLDALDNITDTERWELAQQWALEQAEEEEA